MDDRDDPLTRLGPASGRHGRGPGNARVYHWEWGPDDARRPGLPWVGIFLVVFGGLLLVQQAYLHPEGEGLGALLIDGEDWAATACSSSARSDVWQLRQNSRSPADTRSSAVRVFEHCAHVATWRALSQLALARSPAPVACLALTLSGHAHPQAMAT